MAGASYEPALEGNGREIGYNCPNTGANLADGYVTSEIQGDDREIGYTSLTLLVTRTQKLADLCVTSQIHGDDSGEGK